MIEKEFEGLLNNRENNDLDFKLDLPKSEKVAELVTALYNSRGGKIILGVDNDRNPVGLKNPQEVEHKFIQIIRHYCKLDEEPGIEFVKYKRKDFIVIHCSKGRNTPYLVRNQSKPRVRIGSSNMPANKEEIARLYREGSTESQDIYPVKNATLDDIDLNKIKEYFKESRLTVQLKGTYFHDLLKKENFVVEENGKLIPTTAGIVLFGKHPRLNMPFTAILADRYKGLTVTSWIDRKDIEGDAFTIIEECKQFMLKNMRIAHEVRGFRTEAKTEYPIEALKEAVVNALAHRDYFNRENILIKMFDDRIEIWSSGELLRPLTIEQLKSLNYKPKTRNKTITEVFGRRNLMDKRGTGILRMNELCEKGGLPKPDFKEETGYFGIIFRNPNYYTFEATEIDTTGLNERQKKALEYIRDHTKITRREYVRLTKVSQRQANKDITVLIKKNLIAMHGKGRTVYYTLKV